MACPMLTGVLIPVASTFTSFGIVRSGFVVSTTVMLCSTMLSFPFSSITFHFIMVVPIGNSLVSGQLLEITIGNISCASGTCICTGVKIPVASTLISAGAVTTGLVVSVTVIF